LVPFVEVQLKPTQEKTAIFGPDQLTFLLFEKRCNSRAPTPLHYHLVAQARDEREKKKNYSPIITIPQLGNPVIAFPPVE
jgi:hypothetical protein